MICSRLVSISCHLLNITLEISVVGEFHQLSSTYSVVRDPTPLVTTLYWPPFVSIGRGEVKDLALSIFGPGGHLDSKRYF